MDQEIAVVHQNPFARIVALNAHGPFAHLLQAAFDLVANRVSLPAVGDRANDEIVGKRRNFFQIKNFDIRCLFGAGTAGSHQPIRDFLGRGGLGTARQTRFRLFSWPQSTTIEKDA